MINPQKIDSPLVQIDGDAQLGEKSRPGLFALHLQLGPW